MGARQNQRLVTGPGPTLATDLLQGVRNRQVSVATDLFSVIFNRATSRDRGYVTSPAFRGSVTVVCRSGSSGTGFRLIARYVHIAVYIHTHTYTDLHVCKYSFVLTLELVSIYTYVVPIFMHTPAYVHASQYRYTCDYPGRSIDG